MDSLPVMFWIHGGGYFMGTGASYPAEILAHAGPVVIVTVNYRLGPIGFLSTGVLISMNIYSNLIHNVHVVYSDQVYMLI